MSCLCDFWFYFANSWARSSLQRDVKRSIFLKPTSPGPGKDKTSRIPRPKLCICIGQVALFICLGKNLKKEKSKLYCFCDFNFNGRLLTSLKKINCKEA